MKRMFSGVVLAMGVLCRRCLVSGQSGAAERRVADLRRRSREHALLAARPDQRGQFQQAPGGVAIQDGQPRPPSGIQLRGNAADGERRDVFDGRNAPGRGRAGCGDGRVAVGAWRT